MLNKREAEEFELLKTKLALRCTEKVEYDIQPPPLFSSEILNGYLFNKHSKIVNEACTSNIHHSYHQHNKTNSQRPMPLYSTRLLALKALRNELELEFAKELRKIDLEIEKENQ